MRSEPERTALEERLGYEFRDRELFAAALTHASALPPGTVRDSERFEFLGDAVLDLAIADLLLHAFPEWDEGELSKRRALLVRTPTLAAKARELGLDEAIRLGRGEDRSGGRAKASILAATYESVIGAMYREAGFARVRAIIARHFADELRAGAAMAAEDWKTQLQEQTQAALRTVPDYRLVEEHGPAHARRFTSEVWINGRCLARGEGSSKREAEQQAARAALDVVAAEKPDDEKGGSGLGP
jgi:ribonuclease III